MSSITSIFNIGRQALTANRKALEVTSQNIANIGTPGYTRQEAILKSTRPVDSRPGQLGTGVEVSEVRRVVDRFVENQIISTESNLGRLQAEEGLFSRIEAALTDANGSGINQAFSDFFASLQDLSTNPQGRPERTALLETAKSLIQRVVATDRELQLTRSDANREVLSVIGEINQSATQIADLNKQIKAVEITGQQANDLRDQRQQAMNALSKNIEFNAIEDDLAQVTLFVGNGKPLVIGENVASLQGVPDPDNKKGFVGISFNSGTGSTTDISASLGNGRLKGLVDLRDGSLPEVIESVDKIAAGIINEMNRIHAAGFGLDGSTGNNFFSALTPTSAGVSTNTGSAGVNVSVSDPAVLTFDQYDFSVTGGNYTFKNLKTGTSVTGAYADPATIVFEGLQLDVSGVPANGDAFHVNAHEGAAGSFSIALTDPNKVAASSSSAALPGNNENALLLADIQDKGMSALGSVSLQRFYSGVVSSVGTRTRSAQRNLTVEEGIRAHLGTMRQAVSGVSLDEEMTNIIKFQRSYEAAAKLISVADELFQTLLAMR